MRTNFFCVRVVDDWNANPYGDKNVKKTVPIQEAVQGAQVQPQGNVANHGIN